MIRVFVLHLCTQFEVRRLFRSEDNYDAPSVSTLVGRVTFDLETGVHYCQCGEQYAFAFTLRHGNSPPSAYIRVHPIAAARGTRQSDKRTDTDRQTDTAPQFIMPRPTVVSVITKSRSLLCLIIYPTTGTDINNFQYNEPPLKLHIAYLHFLWRLRLSH